MDVRHNVKAVGAIGNCHRRSLSKVDADFWAFSTRLPSYPAFDRYGIITPVMQASCSTMWGNIGEGMTIPATPERYKHHRFPAEIISHGVWLYDRFCLAIGMLKSC